MTVLSLTLIIFLAVTIAAFAFGAAAYSPSSVLEERLRELGLQEEAKQAPRLRERIDRIIDPVGRALQFSPGDRSRAWLTRAGFRDRRHLVFYQGSRIFGAAALFVITLALTGFRSWLLLLGAAALGLFLPRFLLKRLIRNRQLLITIGLPDALDLTVVCVEAGLSLDQAMQRVGEDLKYAHPELSEEFYLSNLEMKAGKPRAEALRNLADRTGVD